MMGFVNRTYELATFDAKLAVAMRGVGGVLGVTNTRLPLGLSDARNDGFVWAVRGDLVQRKAASAAFGAL
jgi:hypothetical protein